ncbi:MAG: neutral zinc metallopeptidase [Kiritimatiellae bacterium]|nr:neutral zinc metallopeptidase [Kiritimatiellia bacterium]
MSKTRAVEGGDHIARGGVRLLPPAVQPAPGEVAAEQLVFLRAHTPPQGGEPLEPRHGRVLAHEREEHRVFGEFFGRKVDRVHRAELFARQGKRYTPPKLVLFTDAVQSGCGGATKQTGPFYCSADQNVYLDLSFFSSMRRDLGADGDFAYAYVIGHEIGHHVQHLLGTLDQAHARMQRLGKEEANRISVRLELQADFYAGVWAHHDNARFGSLEDGDIEEAIRCAQVIGDDFLQKKARGYVQPDSFTHGTSASRMRWFKRGLASGNLADGDTFSVPFDQL